MPGYCSSDCFGNGFRGVWGSIRSVRAHKLPTPRAGAKNNARGELNYGIALEDMKEEKFPRNGWMRLFEVGHGLVGCGGCLKQDVVFGRQRKWVKVMVGPGSKECAAAYETNSC